MSDRKKGIVSINIAQIKRRRRELIKRIKISLDKLDALGKDEVRRKQLIQKLRESFGKFETLEKEEEIYRERKKVLNLRQNQKWK